MNDIDVTNVKIILPNVASPKLMAFVEITINDRLVIKDMKLIQGATRVFVQMPNRLTREGIHRDIVFPTDKQLRERITRRVIEKYNETTGSNVEYIDAGGVPVDREQLIC